MLTSIELEEAEGTKWRKATLMDFLLAGDLPSAHSAAELCANVRLMKKVATAGITVTRRQPDDAKPTLDRGRPRTMLFDAAHYLNDTGVEGLKAAVISSVVFATKGTADEEVPIEIINTGITPTMIARGTHLGDVYEVDPARLKDDLKMKLSEVEPADYALTGGTRVDTRLLKLFNNFAEMSEAEREARLEYLRENAPDFGPELSSGQRRKLCDLMEEFVEIVSMGPDDLPEAKTSPMVIDTGSFRPVKGKPRPIPLNASAFLDKHMKELIESGIIVASRASWVSPLTIAPKKGPTKWRLCIDYRRLNECTTDIAFRMPTIGDLHLGMKGKRFITALDMCYAYHQMPMDEASQDKTTFVSAKYGMYKFRRVPFGLKCAPAFFQRALEEIMRDVVNETTPTEHVGIYLDDIVIATSTFEEHIALLRKIFTVFRRSNLRLGSKKCQFGHQEVLYLGWIASEKGVRPNPEKVKAIREVHAPTDKKGVRQFMGMVNFYHRAVANLATLSAPLRTCCHRW